MTNRRIDGKLFSQEIINKVWDKAEVIAGFDPTVFRKDKCGAWIKKEEYGKPHKTLSMAWEIDHIKPRTLGGTDELSNLQALQWNNNQQKNNHYPSWSCLVRGVEEVNGFVEG
jgi:HNH endonuclease